MSTEKWVRLLRYCTIIYTLNITVIFTLYLSIFVPPAINKYPKLQGNNSLIPVTVIPSTDRILDRGPQLIHWTRKLETVTLPRILQAGRVRRIWGNDQNMKGDVATLSGLSDTKGHSFNAVPLTGEVPAASPRECMKNGNMARCHILTHSPCPLRAHSREGVKYITEKNPSFIMGDKRYVFAPLAFNENQVIKELKKLDLSGTSCHVLPKENRLMVYSKLNTPDYWKETFYPKEYSSLLDFVVGDNTMNHIARYTIDPRRNKITWVFPHQPVYGNTKENVSKDSNIYRIGMKKKNARMVTDQPHPDDVYAQEDTSLAMKIKRCKVEEPVPVPDHDDVCQADILPLLIVQEGVKIPDDLLQNMKPEFVFGSNIREYCETSPPLTSNMVLLPLAAGSTLYDSDILMHGQPPSSKETAQRFSKRIKYASRIIVVVGDNYKMDPLLKHTQKLNAIYIVVSSNTRNDLDNMNVSMALVHQAPLSTVICYIKGAYYYYRGIWQEQSYGSQVSLSMVLKNGIVIRPGQVCVDDTQVYNSNGVFLFEVEQGREVESVLNYDFGHFTRPGFKLWLGQLEVLLSAADLRKLVTKTIEIMSREKKKNAIQDILNKMELPLLLKNKLIEISHNETFSKRWLLATCMSTLNTGEKFTGKIVKVYNRAWSIYKSTLDSEQWIMAALNDTTSARSSHGVKSLDALKMNVRRDTVAANVKKARNTDLDDLMTDHCQKAGVVIYQLSEKDLEEACDKRINPLMINERLNYMAGYLASSLLDETTGISSISFDMCTSSAGCTGCARCIKYLLLPIVDPLLDIMASEKNMTMYNWRNVKEDDIIAITRIIVRNEIYKFMGNQDFDAGHAKVGRLTLFMLAAAMDRTRYLFKKQPDDPTSVLVRTMRYLFGLCVSIMSSGANAPLVEAYRLFTEPCLPTIRLDPKDRYTIDAMVNAWPYLCFDTKKDLVKDRLMYQLKEETERKITFIFNTKVKPKYIDHCNKITNNEERIRLENKSLWSHQYVRPMCLLLIGREYPFLVDWDNIASNYKNKKYNSTAFNKLDLQSDLNKLNLQSDLNKLNLQSTSSTTATATVTNPSLISEIKIMLEKKEPEWVETETTIKSREYNELLTLLKEADEEYPQFTKASRFMTIMKKFFKDKKIKNTNYIRQVAYCKYIKSSDIFYREKKAIQDAVNQSLDEKSLLLDAIKKLFEAVVRMKSKYSNITHFTKKDSILLTSLVGKLDSELKSKLNSDNIIQFIHNKFTNSNNDSIICRFNENDRECLRRVLADMVNCVLLNDNISQHQYFSVTDPHTRQLGEDTAIEKEKLIISASIKLDKLIHDDDEASALMDWSMYNKDNSQQMKKFIKL
ncbi:uncharacterized protein LOC122267000 [Penaeus japonicus]|uniref:uncharacterized protein LOC122267000 n=1 Tax=Penaeus japonicus TaxID=27405 RepID=UPI001C70C1F2|nr:uncharacterized protein LOC122267000 [Penaeus japonicus]